MKKRWLCGTMALVIGAMAMAGCSGGNSSSSASAAGTEAADSGSSVDTSGAEMTIRVAHVCEPVLRMISVRMLLNSWSRRAATDGLK